LNWIFSENDGKKLLRRMNVGLIHTNSLWRREYFSSHLMVSSNVHVTYVPLYITDVVKIMQALKRPKTVEY
jgi:hypothetical protein